MKFPRWWSRPARRASFLTVALFVTALAGCAGGNQTPDPFAGRNTRSGQLRITVENRNFNDVRILSITTRGRRVLGQVGGASSRNFSIDWAGLDEIRLRMEFLAGDDYESNPVNASPGDQLFLVIPREPRNAFLRRR